MKNYLSIFYQQFDNRKFRAFLILCWIVVTGFFGYQLQFLQVDFEFEKFFPSDDPDIAFYNDHLEKFAYDNDYLILILENEQGVFNQEFLQKVNALSDSLASFNLIEQVISPTGIQHLIKAPLGISFVPLIHVSEPTRYASDSSRIYTHPIYSNFFSDSGKSLMVQVVHTHIQNPEQSELLVTKVATLLQTYGFDHFRIVGKLAAQKTFIRLIKEDFSLFLAGALVLSFILLVVVFRSLQIALLPYLISVTTLVWLLGLMALLNAPITILSSLIPPVILFVSSSDAIHLINSYRNSSANPFTARLSTATHEVFMPTLLTSVTTAIGFFSLISISTEPIQELGIFTGIGVLIAFIVTYLFCPLLIRQKYPVKKASERQKQLALWVLRHPWPVFGLAATLLTLAVVGVTFLKVDAYLLEDLPKDSEVRQDFNFVDENFRGSKPWELAYWPADTSMTIWDPHVMGEARKIQEYLQTNYPMERVWSPVTLIQYGNQMLHGGANTAFEYPETENYETVLAAVRQFSERSELPKLNSNNQKYARFTGYIPEYGSHKTIQKNEQLLHFLKSEIDTDIIHYRLTGTTHLIDKSHELLTANLLKGLLLAILLISLLLALYFRSILVIFISLLPNVIPLLVVAGFMGWMGISLKLTTSIIFAVVFGIAVDDTIHFLSVYKKQKHANRVINLIRTYQSAGNALVITSMIIIAGFSLFTFSSFGATYFLGLFLSLSLAVALLCDLTILPLLLHFGSMKNKS